MGLYGKLFPDSENLSEILELEGEAQKNRKIANDKK